MLYFTQIIYKAGVSEDGIAVLITPAKNKGRMPMAEKVDRS